MEYRVEGASSSVIEPPLHDSFVTGVYIEGSDVRVDFQAQTGRRRFALTMFGVRALSLDGFRLGNIVMDVRIISGRTPLETDLTPILTGLRPLNPVFDTPNTIYPNQIAEEVRQAKATLCVIEPTIGCAMTAICTHVTISATGLAKSDPVQQRGF